MTDHRFSLSGGAAGARTVHHGPLVRTRAEEDVLVLTFTHESLTGPHARTLAQICTGYALEDGGGWTRQAVSLGMVREVNCAGLRALVEIADTLADAAGRLAVFGASARVVTIVRRTGLRDRLITARGLREAIALARDESPGLFRSPGLALFRAA